jgi:hypothetical protein
VFGHVHQLVRGIRRTVREFARYARKKPLIALAMVALAVLNPVLGLGILVIIALAMGQD